MDGANEDEEIDIKTGEVKTRVVLRLDPAMVEALDQRIAEVGVSSRNKWFEMALTWILTSLPTRMPNPERDKVAAKAPPEVAGKKKIKFGQRAF